MRDYVINSGIVGPILTLARSEIPVSFLRNVTWTISNLCRNKIPSPPIEVIRAVLPTLAYLVQQDDTEVLGNPFYAGFLCGARSHRRRFARSGRVLGAVLLDRRHQRKDPRGHRRGRRAPLGRAPLAPRNAGISSATSKVVSL
jgi:hypothetical protein